MDQSPAEHWYEEYMSFKSLEEIGEEYGVSFATVGRYIKHFLKDTYCIEVRDLHHHRSSFYANEFDYLHNMMNEPLKKIAGDYQVDERTVSRIMKKFKVSIKPYHPPTKYSVDEDYFRCIDTHEKAYWLGFISADGCLYYEEKKRSYILSLALDKKDKSHLEKFKVSLASNHPLISDGRNCFQIRIFSRSIFNDLIKLGITPRKTNNVEMPNISSGFYSSFILGYFDGDGTIFIPKKGRATFSIASGSVYLLQQFQGIFHQELNIGMNKLMRNGNLYSISFGGNIKVSLIREWLYMNSSIYMERKKEKMDLVDICLSKKVLIECPYQPCKKKQIKNLSETHLSPKRINKLPLTFCSHSCATNFYFRFRKGMITDLEKVIKNNIVETYFTPRKCYK